MRRAPDLSTHGLVSGAVDAGIYKVLTRAEAEAGIYPPSQVLIWRDDGDDRFAGSFSDDATVYRGRIQVSAPRDADVVQPGDVVRLREGASIISVLFRRGASANSLFITERCNSLCLMCSQPPRDEDDSWRIEELHHTIALIDRDEAQMGFTGGEPTLLGDHLAGLLNACRHVLPQTALHVLTNGRRFADANLARTLIVAGGEATTWAVPIYADTAAAHDEIVGAAGAFEETLEGLFQLARFGARVEIRIVLHKLSLPRLPQLASYIYRRMPFVEHVAFMGLEPMGLAKPNRERLWIDPADYTPILAGAVHHLSARDMNVSIYNLPLCVLPKSLWPFARRSISDWKNVHDGPCLDCAARSECAGFFLSAGAAWRSRGIQALTEEDMPHELA